MAYVTFAERTTGESHIRVGRPCQDYCLCINDEINNAVIFAVADGHGSRKHFRSEVGSRFACEIAVQLVTAFIKDHPDEIPDAEMVDDLKASIVDAWKRKVIDDANNNIWTIEELEEQEALLSNEQYNMLLNGKGLLVPYGSTLIVGFYTSAYYCGMQLGDGGFVQVMQDGSYIWPIPESKLNVGSYTASLCMQNPLPEFRHYISEDQPFALLAYSDGIEKAFPPHSVELAEYLYRILQVARSKKINFRDGIRFGIEKLALNGSVRDDVSIAGIVDLEHDNPNPRMTEEQKNQLEEKIDCLLKECEDTIAYYEDKLKQLDREASSIAKSIEEIHSIIQGKKEQFEELLNQKDELSREWKVHFAVNSTNDKIETNNGQHLLTVEQKLDTIKKEKMIQLNSAEHKNKNISETDKSRSDDEMNLKSAEIEFDENRKVNDLNIQTGNESEHDPKGENISAKKKTFITKIWKNI